MIRRLVALVVGAALAFVPAPARAQSAWGSPGYGDPPGWCTKFSDMWVGTVVTNDPLVGTNPEQETFYGFHRHPGYDDWYGYFYGDFRGVAGDASGWVPLLHEDYPQHYHWNFGDRGWAVHGHAKQYIAYYNWTFGGDCGYGSRGSATPPPYMADQYGYPVVDIYVDAVPPYAPAPYVASVTPDSVAFTWDAVADRGDGKGADYFESGLDHYVSWLTVGDRPGRLEEQVSTDPRTLVLAGLKPGETACVHVEAVDRVSNATPEQSTCASPLPPPPMPHVDQTVAVAANPSRTGLAGFETWLWLSPRPSASALEERYGGVVYELTASPAGVEWDFGDGTSQRFGAQDGAGLPFPDASPVSHAYQADDREGYPVAARVVYDVSWSAVMSGRRFGPYPLGETAVAARPLIYPVLQAQPEVVAV